ncbi:MAG: phosphonate ABC transporter ATP-binding protein [Planctomycetota bacterium]|nr:phosphonate ABC transporter ATP-binding protein [Planctomycetota bacterium]
MPLSPQPATSPPPLVHAEMPRGSAAVVRVRELQMTFPNGTRALRGVSLNVYPGELLVVIGRSGAGKSTLLRCMNRLQTPTSGQIVLLDRDVTHASGSELREVRARVGMVFQQFNLVRRLSVLENVVCGRLRFGATPAGLMRSLVRGSTKHDRRIAMECLATVGIERLAHQRADTLSGGQQQRVAIARTLAQDPLLILADEPIASLDPVSADAVMESLRRIQQDRGIPVVVNLHQVDIARAFATRIVGMAAGEVVFDGAPESLSEEGVARIYAGAPQAGGVPASGIRASSPLASEVGADALHGTGPEARRIAPAVGSIAARSTPAGGLSREPLAPPRSGLGAFAWATMLVIAGVLGFSLARWGGGLLGETTTGAAVPADSSGAAGLAGSSSGQTTPWPKRLVLGFVPTEGGADLADRFAPFVEHLRRSLDIEVQTFTVTDYASMITAMSQGHVDAAYFGPKSYVEAALRANAEAIAVELNGAGEPGYHSVIIARRDSSATTIENVRGKTFAVVDPNSTSGYLVPQILFRRDLGTTAEEFFREVKNAGSHQGSILAVKHGEVDAGATSDLDLRKIAQSGQVSEDEFTVLWRSDMIPGSPIAARRSLPPAFRMALLGAILSASEDPKVVERMGNGGFAPATDSDYDVIRYLQRLKEQS